MTPRQMRVASVRPSALRMGCFAFSRGSFGSLGARPRLGGSSLRLLLTFTLRPPVGCTSVRAAPRWIFLDSFEIRIAS